MSKRSHDLNRLHVASPCSVDWNEMSGDERVRICARCDRHIHNLSEMTKEQAERLVSNTNGRLCVRYVQRADGKICTKDYSITWLPFRKRAVRITAGLFTAILSVGANNVTAQTPLQTDNKSIAGGIIVKTAQGNSQPNKRNARSIVTGTVFDPNGAVIPNLNVMLTNNGTKQVRTTTTNGMGVYKFTSLEAGTYTLNAELIGLPKFSDQIILRAHKQKRLDVQLSPLTYFVGILEPVERKSTLRKVADVLALPYKGLKKLFSAGS